MNEIREIVTKAIVGKGRGTVKLKEQIEIDSDAYSILGCWIINHTFDSLKRDDQVYINGDFELNIWYSQSNNSKTDIKREIIKYDTKIGIKQVVQDYLDNSDDILVKSIQQPTCVDAVIDDNNVIVDIVFELSAEVIGETKMKVSIFNQNEQVEEDIDKSVNVDFIDKK